MNHDENNLGRNAANDLELEARVVAAVLGEASAFELAELDRLLADKPELAVFKKRIEAVHGLVGDAARPEKEPMKMSAERRSKLMESLGATAAPSGSATAAAVGNTAVYPPKRAAVWRRALPIAAGLMIGLFVSMAVKYSGKNYNKAAIAQRSERQAREVVLTEAPEGAVSPPALSDKQEAPSVTSVDAMGQVASDRVDRYIEAGKPTQIDAARRAELDRGEDEKRVQMPQLKVREGESLVGSKWSARSLAGAVPSGASARSDDSPVPMQKFEANASRELGFVTSNSLAGSRVNSLTYGAGSPASVTPQKAVSEITVEGPGTKRRLELKDAAKKQDEPVARVFDHGEIGGAAAAPFTPPPPANLPLTGKETQLAQTDTETIVLSPFEVATERKNKGYFSFNGRDKKAVNKPSAHVAVEKPMPAPAVQPKPEPAPVSPSQETRAAQQPVSTFSLHVSDVSFRLAHAALLRGVMPDSESIRPEEFYNAFNYGDPAPAMTDKVACRIEQSAHPMLQQRNLVRIAVKVPATGHGAGQALRLTVLLDTSGSMEREDRAAAVRSALGTLVSLLGADDRLTLIGFARQPRLLAEDLPGNRAREALDLLARTPAEGGTNLEEALNLARDLARRHKTADAQNRIVLLTDGAANLGNADPAKLAASIEALRQQGIAFDACGVGTEGVDDSMLEALTRKGDGRYYVLNSAEAADAGFARQLAGAFRPAAQNVKLQVRFNPARVGSYRLIGFEQHRLKEEDFRNDKVDAAELAADEAAIAVYQVETLPQGEGEVGEVYVRFRDTATGNMVERSWTLSYDAHVAAFDRATPSMQLAGVAALVAEKLQDGPAADAIKLDELTPVVNRLRGHYANEPRVQELVQMFEQLRRLEAK